MTVTPNLGAGVVTTPRAARSGVRIPAGAGDFSLLQNVQTISGDHPASYSFLEVKRPGREVKHSPPPSADVENGVDRELV